MKTYITKPADIERKWHLIDATDQTLGRLSTRIAKLLLGKHKPMFTPSLDTGDFVVVINAGKVRVTGNKTVQKLYHRHSGYPGGFKSITLEKMMQEHPTRVIKHAVEGMLPHTRLGARMKTRLRIYADDKQPHLIQAKTGTEKETK